ncbi:MAG: DUF4837 family protein [Chlorobi bacterium]|nr:DUF4837 family protein [Chlorobiota bacterium]
MIQKINSILLAALIVLSMASCSKTKKNTKARSIGNTSEILIVVQNEKQWNNAIGAAIKDEFTQEQYGLNQAEPLFRLSHVQISGFSDMFKKHHNIFIVNIDGLVKKPLIEASTNFWSQPQQIFKITCASAADFVKIFNENAGQFISAYEQTDRDRIMEVFRSTQNAEAVTQVKKTSGIKMVIPKDFYLAKNTEDFIWLRKEQIDMSQAIFIISTDYKDTAQFSQASILSRIKKALKTNVPGAVYDSYMTIDEEFVPPVSRKIKNFPTDYAIETTGIWTVKNDFMGGPFKAYTFYNAKSGKIVTMMAYVYKPNEKKRNLLKQVVALIYSSKI